MKINKSEKKFFVVLTIFVLLLSFTGCSVWRDFYDVTGLTLYKNQKIVEMIPSIDRYYLITEDGSGYMMGGYDFSHNQKYRNSESYSNRKLGTYCTPVMFYEDRISQAWVYSNLGLLFVNEHGSLYDLHDMDVNFVCENVKRAWKYDNSSDYLLDCKYGDYLIIDYQNQLFSFKSTGEKTILLDDVIDVRTVLSTLYVLFQDGSLCEFSNFKNGVKREDGKLLFENVNSFDIATDFDGCAFQRSWPIDISGLANAPINVLTNEGQLYLKGTYDLNEVPNISYSIDPEPKDFDQWTLIGENVVQFSISKIGTLMLLDNSECFYYGFDNYAWQDEKLEFGYKQIDLEDILAISSSTQTMIIECVDSFYIWSGNCNMVLYPERDVSCKEHSIFTGKPFIIKK